MKKKAAKTEKVPAFVVRAQRAMNHAAENVRAQNRAHNLPLILWRDGKLVKEAA